MDWVIAISETVRQRIERFHNIRADVIYPPVDTSRFRCEEFEGYWLSVNRIYPEKRMDLQFEVFRRLPEERLIIVGGYAQGDHASRYFERLTRDNRSICQMQRA